MEKGETMSKTFQTAYETGLEGIDVCETCGTPLDEDEDGKFCPHHCDCEDCHPIVNGKPFWGDEETERNGRIY